MKTFMYVVFMVLLCGGSLGFGYKICRQGFKDALIADKKIQYAADETTGTTKMQLLDSTLINTFKLFTY